MNNYIIDCKSKVGTITHSFLVVADTEEEALEKLDNSQVIFFREEKYNTKIYLMEGDVTYLGRTE